MSARDKLQRDVLEALADDATLLTITVDFARGVLAEMDEPRLLKLWEIELLHDAGWEYAFIPEARQLRAALAAALATLAEVRAEHQPKTEPCCDCSKLCDVCAKECASCEQQSPCDTIHILDRSTP